MTPGGWVSSMRVASSALTDSSSQTGWVWESRSNTLILLFNESYPESFSPPTPLQLGNCSWTLLPWPSSLADTQSEVSLPSAGGFQQHQEQHLHIRKSGVKSSWAKNSLKWRWQSHPSISSSSAVADVCTISFFISTISTTNVSISWKKAEKVKKCSRWKGLVLFLSDLISHKQETE